MTKKQKRFGAFIIIAGFAFASLAIVLGGLASQAAAQDVSEPQAQVDVTVEDIGPADQSVFVGSPASDVVKAVESDGDHGNPGPLYLILALIALAIIIFTSLKVEKIGAKVLIFLGLGGGTVGFLMTQGEHAMHILHHTFAVDYVQFITIPLATVLIASLNLFKVKIIPGTKLGWFLGVICPIIGNFGTTWALVPVCLSLVPTLKEMYKDTWKEVLIATCIFSMNMLALATLAADPPQALWAVKVSLSGTPLGFFFPFAQFWVYLMFTWALYLVVLARLGVKFGKFSQVLGVRPDNWGKFAYGMAIAIGVGLSITFLKGYEIAMVLGVVCVVALASVFLVKPWFGHTEQHQTNHWVLETATIFVAFFSVVAFAHAGLEYVQFSNQGMVGSVIGLTLGADNAAAFAAAYPQYETLDQMYMVWYNLKPAVTYGGISPLGNGPQITLFLIILVGLGFFTAKEVFVVWFKEACVFAPYLAVWTLTSTTLIDAGVEFSIPIQLITGIVAFIVANQMMDLQSKFRIHVSTGGGGWDGRNGNGAD